MLHYTLIAAQIIVLIVLGIVLWQVWQLLHSKKISDDEPLGEEQTNFLTRKLRKISICVVLESLLQIASAVLRFVESN